MVRFLPFDDEGAGGPAILVKVRPPVGTVDSSRPPPCGNESVSLDAVVHGVAGANALLAVAGVQDALGTKLVG